MNEEYQSNRIRLFREPRCCTFVGAAIAIGLGGTAATGASIGAAAAGVGLGAASAAGAFSPSVNEPDTSAEATQMEQLQAQFLPAILGEEAAAQEGTSYTLPADIQQLLQQNGISVNGGQVSPQQQQQLQTLQGQLQSLQQQAQNASTTTPLNSKGMPEGASPAEQLQGQIQQIQSQISQIQQSGGDTINFQGQGTANAQGQIMNQEAQGQLAEGQEFDPQFIAQQLAEEQQANPQQFSARQAEYQMMENAINNPQTSPVADTMENQIQERVNAGSNLTPEEQQMLNAAVASQPNEGTTGGSPDFSNDLTSGFAGEQRALQNAGSGATFLASGDTPADLAYRQQQANLGNLSSYVSGATPESQFSEVSGAQGQPTPNYESSYIPSYNGQAAATEGATGAANQFGENVQEQLTQSNPWVAGLSGVLGGANALAGAGVI